MDLNADIIEMLVYAVLFIACNVVITLVCANIIIHSRLKQKQGEKALENEDTMAGVVKKLNKIEDKINKVADTQRSMDARLERIAELSKLDGKHHFETDIKMWREKGEIDFDEKARLIKVGDLLKSEYDPQEINSLLQELEKIPVNI